MKTIILYTRRNVGLCALSFLVAKGFNVKVISDDENILWMAEKLLCDVVELDSMGGFDLFICCHGNKIIPEKYLQEKKFINVHPCLKYKGHNPIKRYIANGDTEGSVEVQWLINEVDAGEVIHGEYFSTPVIQDYASFYNIALPFYFKAISKTLELLNV